MRIASLAAFLLAACQAYTPKPLEGAERQQAYDAYMTEVHEKVAATWRPLVGAKDYPNYVFNAGKTTSVVWLVVDAHGDIIATDVVRPGAAPFDREAIRAVSMATPLPPPPEGLMYRSSRGLVAGVPISFSVTVPGAAGTVTQGRFLGAGNKAVNVTPSEIALEL